MIWCHNPLERQAVVMVYKDRKVLPDSFRDSAPKLINESSGTLPNLESKTAISTQYLSFPETEVHTIAGVSPCRRVLIE